MSQRGFFCVNQRDPFLFIDGSLDFHTAHIVQFDKAMEAALL